MTMTLEEELELLAMLGLCQADFKNVTRMPSYEQGLKELENLKSRCRKGLRKAALQLHPDQNGGDPEKTALFSKLANFVKRIEGLQLQQQPPPMPVFPGFNVTGTTAGRTTTTINVIFAVGVPRR